MKYAACFVALILITGPVLGQSASLRPGIARLDLTSPEQVVVRAMGAGLFLRIDRCSDSHGHHCGWDVDVLTDSTDRGTGVLLPVRPLHGPFYTDVYAWSARQQMFPDERHLWIANPPCEVVLQLTNYDTTPGTDVSTSSFTRGTLEVRWRPVKAIPDTVR
jgi:hypothetical protein